MDCLSKNICATRRSVGNGGNNEILEFNGDSILGFIVGKLLIDEFGSFSKGESNLYTKISDGVLVSEYQEDKLTEIKQRLVQRKMLADCICMLDLDRFLLMGKGDFQNNVNKQDSVKEDLFEAIIGAVALDCNYDIRKTSRSHKIHVEF